MAEDLRISVIVPAFRAERHLPRVLEPLIGMKERGEVAGWPPADWDSVIVATGPLTSPALAAAIREQNKQFLDTP